MKKLLSRTMAVSLLLLPTITFAAYNDVSLDSNANFSVNSTTVSVSGSNNVIQTLTINNDNTFTLDLVASTTITISASKLDVVSMTPAFGYTASCVNSTQTLTFSPGVSSTVIIRPSSTVCDASTSSSSSGGGGPPSLISGGGGGGGYTAPVITTAKSTAIPTTSTPSNTSTISSAPSFTRDLDVGMTGEDAMQLQVFLNNHGFTITSAGPGSRGNETNKFGMLTRAALAKFQSANGISPASGYFGPKTRAVINGGATASPSPNSASVAVSGSFTRDLDVGMTGEDAMQLQVFLNNHGFTITSAGPGSRGNETNKFGMLTRAALAKFQSAKGISPASGYFGPKTRAVVNKMGK